MLRTPTGEMTFVKMSKQVLLTLLVASMLFDLLHLCNLGVTKMSGREMLPGPGGERPEWEEAMLAQHRHMLSAATRICLAEYCWLAISAT